MCEGGLIDERILEELLAWTAGDEALAQRFYNHQVIPSLGRTLSEAVAEHGPAVALEYIAFKNDGGFE